ncbi:LOW QUALITY PROTEIN: glycoprotein-N-acetylgalactosamine 3-beta-galactosyltransferase 1-like [Penaeus monodon]|uniref:LOW QUALITY PROTEIN: glycoprotein-N-acetylgalactosamine 3-beta-galactosyltransferase 1-like n=1 Tax=Penaeus monodon TaxID=6687 RepID=UPI0018A70FF0|nr:LOW QUALITY PROTEIN: glycoprotein-N-acetylgalactosamine 3-beta-galactosyltransferase 1-like [Penaeus monodon]
MIWRRRRTCLPVLLLLTLSFVSVVLVFRFLSHTQQDKTEALLWKEFPRSPRRTPLKDGSSRVTCLVVTSPGHHEDRARHQGAAWRDPRPPTPCPKTFFLSSATHPDLPNVILSNYTGYEDLWGKVLHGLRAVDAASAQWFLKADDDTFLLYPRLLDLLGEFDSSVSLFLGLPLVFTDESRSLRVEYMSGGAGYVLSSPAVRLLQKTLLQECHLPGLTSYEDVNMGACMAALGVRTGDTRDALGRARFLPYPPWVLMREDLQHQPGYSWLQRMSKFPFNFGIEHMSDRSSASTRSGTLGTSTPSST